MQDFTQQSQLRSADQAAVSAEALFFQRIYTWMCGGLALTAGVAYFASKSYTFVAFMYSSWIVPLGAFFLLLGIVWYLESKIEELSPAVAKTIFLVYATLVGAIFCGIAIAYSDAVIFMAFASTSVVYGAMAVYGMVTKKSLEGWGAFLYMGCIGLLVVIVINIFVGSSLISLGIGIIGVFIFAGLTAYEHQALRVIHATGLDGTEDGESRQVILGALTLYITFVNMFLMMLRIFGFFGGDD